MIHAIDLAEGFVLSDDPARLDLDVIHRFLSEDSYWAKGRDRALVERSVANALPMGLYAPGGAQAGFAMAVTDRAVFAWMSNVFILPPYRGRGLGEALVRALLEHPELATISRWVLNTRDAHGLYAKFGFVPVQPGPNAMERRR
jgi:GNAT superfamily N-acetyltransferase